jgi:multiple sugar transport system permease protein
MVVTALKTDSEMAKLATNPWFIYEGVTLDQFRILLNSTDFLLFFKNTIIVTVCVVVITMVVSVLAAFALGRMRFWGSSILATGIFLTYLVPDTLLFIPMFQIVKGLGLLNSYWGMVLVYPTLTVPFCTWIMIGYFQSIPKELDEAALIDGASAWQKFIHITLPMMHNIIAITVLFSLIVTFANFDVVQIMTAGGPRNMTHMFATYSFLLGIRSGDLPLGAATSLFMLPILAIAAIFILRGVRKRGREIG